MCAWVYVCVQRCLWRPEGIGLLETEVIGGCEQPYGCWELNPRSFARAAIACHPWSIFSLLLHSPTPFPMIFLEPRLGRGWYTHPFCGWAFNIIYSLFLDCQESQTGKFKEGGRGRFRRQYMLRASESHTNMNPDDTKPKHLLSQVIYLWLAKRGVLILSCRVEVPVWLCDHITPLNCDSELPWWLCSSQGRQKEEIT